LVTAAKFQPGRLAVRQVFPTLVTKLSRDKDVAVFIPADNLAAGVSGKLKEDNILEILKMKLTYSIALVILTLTLKGQNTDLDSLRKSQRGDAWWAITHEDYSKGKKILEKLIKEEPNNPENYFVEATIYYFKKKVDSLTICLEKALDLGKDSMRVYREFYRYYHFKQEDKNTSLLYMNKMISLQQNNSNLYMERSVLLTTMKDFENSYKDLEKAASLGNEEAKKGIEYINQTNKKLREKGLIK